MVIPKSIVANERLFVRKPMISDVIFRKYAKLKRNKIA